MSDQLKPTDIRLGNILHHIDSDLVVIVTDICRNAASLSPNDYWLTASAIFKNYICNYPIEGFKPIPLTEEWLKKFNFNEKYKSTSNRWLKWASNINAGLELHDCEDEKGNTHGVFLHDFGLEVKYVHQLQNLYYAKTGEELILNNENKQS